jgi:hypothetical protein
MPGRIKPGKTAEQRKKEQDIRENAQLARAEEMFERMIQQGKVTPANIRQIKERIAEKTGAYPLGGTN